MTTGPVAVDFAAETSRLGSQIDEYVRQRHIAGSLLQTRTLCRLLFHRITSLVRAIVALTPDRHFVECQILSRSLVEYIVDLDYVTTQDSIQVNRMFVGYHKLFKYWVKDSLVHHADHIPAIVEQYREHVKAIAPEEVGCGQIDEEKWRQIDRAIRKKFGRHWSSLDSNTRIARSEAKIQEKRPLISVLPRLFKFYSQYTHTSPYSVVPGFDPKDESFDPEDFASDEALNQVVRDMFGLLDYSVSAYSIVLGEVQGRETRRAFYQFIDENPPYKAAIIKQFSLYATRPRD